MDSYVIGVTQTSLQDCSKCFITGNTVLSVDNTVHWKTITLKIKIWHFLKPPLPEQAN